MTVNVESFSTLIPDMYRVIDADTYAHLISQRVPKVSHLTCPWSLTDGQDRYGPVAY